jgi:hypothetical protein
MMIEHKALDSVQLMLLEAAILGERDGFEPKLGDASFTLHVSMRWFASVRAEENKRIWTIPENGWHR